MVLKVVGLLAGDATRAGFNESKNSQKGQMSKMSQLLENKAKDGYDKKTMAEPEEIVHRNS